MTRASSRAKATAVQMAGQDSGMMPTVDEHFAGKAAGLRDPYDRLVVFRGARPGRTGPEEDVTHLGRRAAFAGVAVRKEHLVLTIQSDRPINSPRVVKSEHESSAA